MSVVSSISVVFILYCQCLATELFSLGWICCHWDHHC